MWDIQVCFETQYDFISLRNLRAARSKGVSIQYKGIPHGCRKVAVIELML